MSRQLVLSMLLVGAALGTANAQSTSSSTPDAPNDSHGTMAAPDIFRQLDTNKDQRISLQEFRRILPLMPPAAAGTPSQMSLRPEHLDATFKAWDKNRDQSLSREEFTAGLDSIKPSSPGPAPLR